MQNPPCPRRQGNYVPSVATTGRICRRRCRRGHVNGRHHRSVGCTSRGIPVLRWEYAVVEPGHKIRTAGIDVRVDGFE